MLVLERLSGDVPGDEFLHENDENLHLILTLQSFSASLSKTLGSWLAAFTLNESRLHGQQQQEEALLMT